MDTKHRKRIKFQLKDGCEKIGNRVLPPNTGDNGEAVSKSPQKNVLVSQKDLKQPSDAGWFVAVVRCNCEKKIADAIETHFTNRGVWFEYWVPMQRIVFIDKRTNKRKIKEKVCPSTFIFCHVGKAHLNEIRFRPDVYKMLTMPGQREIYQIRDKELYDYRRLVENPDVPVVACSGPLKKGQKVRIIEGKMAGLEAYVQRVSGKKVVIGNEIKYVSGATIEIDRAFLEIIENP